MGSFETLSDDLIKKGNFHKLTGLIDKYLKKQPEEINLLDLMNSIKKLEINSGRRKPSLGIYDHAFHFIGGAQKYGLTIVEALKDLFDITIIASKEVTIDQFTSWYNLDLSDCKVKIVPIPFYEESGDSPHIDPSRVTRRVENPFHVISRESARYDLFINNSMLEKIYPLSTKSLMICHFPERLPADYFYSDLYTETIYNSHYTEGWIKDRWNYTPHRLIYPPADMEQFLYEKQKLIISVARFEEGGTKKQYEMVSLFIRMHEKIPELKEWQLVLAGGSTGENPYLRKVEDLIEASGLENIEIVVNIPERKLRTLYANASIFWHLCGLGQNDPAKVEHFGMTIAEAMQNRVAPIVFNGGGQREIVTDGINGFRASSLSDLAHYTEKLISDPGLLEKTGQKAWEKSQEFSKKRFIDQFRDVAREILNNLIIDKGA